MGTSTRRRRSFWLAAAVTAVVGVVVGAGIERPALSAASAAPAFDPAFPGGTSIRWARAGETLGRWSVTRTGVAVIPDGRALNGITYGTGRSVLLDTIGNGALAQTFAVNPGVAYTLTFLVAGTPGAPRPLAVRWNGRTVFTEDVVSRPHDDGVPMARRTVSLPAASGSSATILFEATRWAWFAGPVIADVTLSPVPAPTTTTTRATTTTGATTTVAPSTTTPSTTTPSTTTPSTTTTVAAPTSPDAPIVSQVGAFSTGAILVSPFYVDLQSPFVGVGFLDRIATGGTKTFERRFPSNPVYDFKRQPNGQYTYYDGATKRFVALDANFAPVRTWSMVGYTADLHDLQLLPDGHALLMAYVDRAVGAQSIGGKPYSTVTETVIQELDAAGTVVFEWRSWEHFTPADSYDVPNAQGVFDYLHANSLEVDEDGNLLVSFRHLWSVVKIDRSTGAVLWQLGGKHNGFTGMDPTGFRWQHDARRQANGEITLFDNHNGSYEQGNASSAVAYRVDEVNMTVRLERRIEHSPAIASGFMGNVQVLDNGDWVVGWGGTPVAAATEYAPDGSVVAELTLRNPAAATDPAAKPAVSYRALVEAPESTRASTADFVQVVSTTAGKCLDIEGTATAPGTPAILYTCSTGYNQQFRPAAVGDGSERLVARHSGGCLDGGSAAVLQQTCSTASSQQWRVSGDAIVDAGTGRCLALDGGATADRTAIVTAPCDGSAAQRFSLRTAT